MSKAPGRCDACGDPPGYREVGPVSIPLQWNGRVLCQECYDELAHGKIINQNVNFFGGPLHHGSANQPVEKQWRENAIRQMEDG